MVIYTDNVDYAEKITRQTKRWNKRSVNTVEDKLRNLVKAIFKSNHLYSSQLDDSSWKYLFIVKQAPQSQFDILYKYNNKDVQLPNGILCLAGSGDNFHGYRNRAWEAVPGNLHLSVCFSPNQEIENFHIGFTILSAVSVIQTLDCIPELKNKTGIKWVNDILIENSKISGVIAQTQSVGKEVKSAILGIGLNIENSPQIEASSYVPKTTSVFQHIKNKKIYNFQFIFNKLIHYVFENYQILLHGGYLNLLERYRQRSLIIGEKVIIYSDPVDNEMVKIAEGRVLSIGENLELFLENKNEPVRHGRLVIPK